MIDFDVGDLVACVDDSPSIGGFVYRLGMVFEVARIWTPEETRYGEWIFDEVGRQPHEVGHSCYRFRKLRKRPMEFFAGSDVSVDAPIIVPSEPADA